MAREELDIKGKVLDINIIQKILPHRYPFLLVDRIIESTDKKVVGVALAVALASLLFVLSKGHDLGWGHPLVLGLAALFACAACVFVLVERRVAHPALDLRLFAPRPHAPGERCRKLGEEALAVHWECRRGTAAAAFATVTAIGRRRRCAWPG